MKRREVLLAVPAVYVTACREAMTSESRNVLHYGADPTGMVDSTAAIQAALDSGGRIVIPEGHYKVTSLTIPSRVVVDISARVLIERLPSNGSIFFFDNSEDAHVNCNGAILDGSAVATGNGTHTIKMLGARRSTLWDANIIGASKVGKDGIYLGIGEAPCQDCHIGGGSVSAALRNGISVVAAHDCTIDRMEISGTTGGPGAGIDVEANDYGDVNGITLSRIRAHDNQGIGIANIFGENVYIDRARCYDNGGNGIAVSAGGAQFNDGVARPIDKRAISSFDPATGNISVDTDELPLGCLVQFIGEKPSELQSQVRWIVTNVGQGFVCVGTHIGGTEVTSFSNAGGDCNLYTYVGGQASGTVIDRARVCGSGADKEISIGLAVDTVVKNSRVTGNTIGINASFSRNTTITGNRIKESAYGINASTATNLTAKNNVSTVNRYNFVSGDYE